MHEECIYIAKTAWEEDHHLNEKLKSQIEMHLILQHSEQLLENSSLKILLRLIAQRGDRLVFKEAAGHFMEQILARRLGNIIHSQNLRQTALQASEMFLLFQNRSVAETGFQSLLHTLRKELIRHGNHVHGIEQRVPDA